MVKMDEKTARQILPVLRLDRERPARAIAAQQEVARSARLTPEAQAHSASQHNLRGALTGAQVRSGDKPWTLNVDCRDRQAPRVYPMAPSTIQRD